jgi:hypothetical protein
MTSNAADEQIDLSMSRTPQNRELQLQQQRLDASYHSQSSFQSFAPMASHTFDRHTHTAGEGAFPLGMMSPLKCLPVPGAASNSMLQSSYGATHDWSKLGIDERNAAASISLLRGGGSVDNLLQSTPTFPSSDQRMTKQQHPLPITSSSPGIKQLHNMTHGLDMNNFATQLELEAAQKQRVGGKVKEEDLLTPMSGSSPPASASLPLSSQQVPPVVELKEFPFVFEHSGWSCRHCAHWVLYQRGPNFYMHGEKPPSNDFVDFHLRCCPALNQNWPLFELRMTANVEQHYQIPIQNPPEEEEKSEHTTPEEEKKPSRKRQHASTSSSPVGIGDITLQAQAVEAYKEALSLLQQRADNLPRPSTSNDVGATLVQEDDTTLLTDYFYYMSLQLTVCRFNEEDRQTRGNKRKNVQLGFGGLQCSHCASTPSARKFFWSSVDRLSNSFAEIPAHVLTCVMCPEDVKEALLVLKTLHPTQMKLLPRGSQKIFLRRMWRRLHDDDAVEARTLSRVKEEDIALKPPLEKNVSAPRSTGEEHDLVMLAVPQDKDWLSDLDCFVRKQIEVFRASKADVEHAVEDQKCPIQIGQVGLRCLHCAKGGRIQGDAVTYPCALSGIYESVKEWQHRHLDGCTSLPPPLKRERSKHSRGASSLSSVLRRYYVQAARGIGLYDSEDGGIRLAQTDFNSEGQREEEKPAKKARV